MSRPPPLILPGEPPPAGYRLLERSWPIRPDQREPLLNAVITSLSQPGLVAPDDRTWLRLCLDEAVINAFYHGGEGDPQLSITVTVWLDEQRWTVWISDHGPGFSVADIPRIETPEDLLREHGRGIRLMQEWLDELSYHRGGRLASLSRRRADRIPAQV